MATARITRGATPASQAGRRALRGAVAEPTSTAQSTTSKNPIQPSSANSLTCAWNMYFPV